MPRKQAREVNERGLLGLPINLCAGIIGSANCNQEISNSGGSADLISVPFNICAGVLGSADCTQLTGGASAGGATGGVTTPVVGGTTPVVGGTTPVVGAAIPVADEIPRGLVSIPVNAW